MKLYGHPESGHSYKVKLMLELAEIPYDYEIVDILVDREARPEPFRSLSKPHYSEVPLLQDGDHVMAQSNAILWHLSSRFQVFGGQDLGESTRIHEWLFWEANKIGLSLPHLRLARNYFPEEFSAEAVEWLQSRYNNDSDRLERELSDGRSYLLGQRMTVADLSICSYLFWANQAQVAVPPFTRKWLARIASEPRWQSPYRMLSPSHAYTTFGLIKAEFDPLET